MGKTINEGVQFLPKKNIVLSDIASERGNVIYKEGDQQLTSDLHEFGMDAVGVLGNHQEEAALLQPFTNKAWRAGKNFTALAGTTFLDGIFGTVAGLSNMAVGGEDGVVEFNDFVNNPLSAGLQEYVEEARKDNVRYKTVQQNNNEWYENAGTFNFWFDQLENAGFMVGALGAGVLTGGVGAEVMGIRNTAKLSKLVNALSKAEASGDVAKIAAIRSKMTALKLNPLQSEQIADDIIQMADKIKMRTAVNQVTSATLGAMGEARIEAITNGKDFEEQQLAILKEQYGEDIPEIRLKELEDASKYMQNTIFGMNTAILSLSNYTQFKNLFTGGVKLNENIAKSLVTEATDGSGKYALKQMSKSEKLLRKTVAGGKNPISEMTEEQLQFAVSEGSKNYFDLENDAESKDWVMNVLGSTYAGLAKAYGSAEGWENAFGGLLMGAIGLPSIKRSDKNKLGLSIEMGGGIATGLREYNSEMKATEAAVVYANKYATEANFRKLFDFNTTDASIQKAKKAALLNDNEAAFRTADKVQLANMVSAFNAIGKLDDLKSKLNDIESIVKGIDAVEAPTQKQLLKLKEQAAATTAQIQELESLPIDNEDAKFKADMSAEIEKHKVGLEKITKAIEEAEAKGTNELSETNSIEEDRKARVAKAADSLRTLLSFKTTEEKDGKQIETIQDSFSDIKDDDTLIETVQKSITKKRELIDSMLKTRNAVDTTFANKSEEVRNSLYLNTIQQEDLVKRGNKLLEELKSLNIKESDEDLSDDTKDWRSKTDIVEFSNLLNKEGGLDRFIKAANNFQKANPTHDATINKFVDLITIAKFRNATIQQYYELVTNDKLIDEEIERQKIDMIKKRRERIARDKATSQAVLNLYDSMTTKVKSLDETKEEFVSGTITLTGKDDKGNTIKKVLYFKENDPNKLYSKGDEGTKRRYVNTADIIESIQDSRTGKNRINYVEYLDNFGSVTTTAPEDGKYVANIFRYDKVTYEDGVTAARKIEVSNEETRIQARIDSLEALITESEDFLKEAEETEVGEITKELEVLQQEAKQLDEEITARESSNRFNTKAAKQKTEKLLNKLVELDSKIQKLIAVKQQRLDNIRNFYADVIADISTFKANLSEAQERQKLLIFTGKEYVDKKTDDFIGGDYNKRLEEAKAKYKEAEAQDPFIFEVIAKLENDIEVLESTSKSVKDIVKKFVDAIKEQIPYIEYLPIQGIWKEYILNAKGITDKNVEEAIKNFIVEISELAPVEYIKNSIGFISDSIDSTIQDLKNKLDNKKLDKELLDAQKSFNRQLNDYRARLTEIQKGRDFKQAEQAKLIGNEKDKGIETTLWDGSTIEENKHDAIPVDLFQWFVSTGRDSDKNWDKDSQNETPEERRVFRWIENEAVKHNIKLSDLRLMTVTIHDLEYGLGKKNSVYNNEKVTNEDPYLSNHNDDDIRLILFNAKTGKPVEAYGGIVYTTMRTPNINFAKENEGVRYSFYSDNVGEGLNKEEKADVLKNALDANKKMRETIKATPEKNYFLDVHHVVQGRMIAEKESNSVLGTLADSVEEIDNIPIIISTGKVDTESKKMVYAKGRILLSDTRNANVSRVVPANTRKLNEVEAETVFQLIKRYITTYANTVGDSGTKETAAASSKDLPYQLPTLLKNLIYLGSSSKNPIFMKGEYVFITLPTGETEAIKADSIENYKEFIKGVLKEKVLQVDAQSLTYFNNNKKDKKSTVYKEVTWTGNEFETVEWPSYKHYLLSPVYPDGTPRNTSEIPITVKLRMKQVGVTDEDILAGKARRYQGGYIVFGSELKDRSQTMTEKKEGTKKDNSDKPTIEKVILTSKKFSDKKITIDLKDNKISFSGFDFKGMDSSIIEAVNTVIKESKLLENLSKASETELSSVLDEIYKLITKYSNISANSSTANYNIEILRNTAETAVAEEANDNNQSKEDDGTVEDSGIVNNIEPLDFFGGGQFDGGVKTNEEKQSSNKENSTNQEDAFDDMFNRLQTEDEDIPVIDTEQAMQNLADLLGENAVSEERLGFVKGLIDGVAGGRILKNGRILLSEIATLGTEYHEAFHYVSQFLISAKEREELYAEWRTVNNKPNATAVEVEEGLAEGFRNYALYKREGQNKKQTSLFRRLLDLIKTALSLNTSKKIDDFYDRIDRKSVV
jgi:nucleoid-associated protein YgaU